MALAPSTVSSFFTGARLISRGNLELLVEHLEGDVRHAEQLRRKAVAAWDRPHAAGLRVAADSYPPDDTGSRLDIVRYDAAVNTLNRPERLIGRDELVAQIHRLLDGGYRVMLYGLAGCGKTALAATVADQRVTSGKGSYLWLRTGGSDGEAVFDGIVRALATPDERTRVAASIGDAQLQAMREILSRSGIRLWVIDDVWRPQVLHTVLRVLPEHVGVLVTSRLKLDLEELIDVGDLAPDDAVALLSLHARQALSGADELCRELGNHAYALEIAGRHLRQYDTTPTELRQLLQHAPHTLAMPGGFSAEGRESVQRLLDRSYQALDSDDARLALGAIAAFSSGTASVDLVATYLEFDVARTRLALNRLVDVSLAKRTPAMSAYSVHDLTFAYARSAGDGDAIAAATRFVQAHIRDYPLLALEMDNLIAAAATARTTDPESFLIIVESLAVGGYLDDHGHTLGLLRLLDEAIEQVRGQTERQHTLLTKRGNAAYNQGEHEQAIHLYVRALDVAPSPPRRVVLMSLIGKVLAELDRHEEADEQFQQAYALADAAGDEESRLRILEQHSVAAFRRRDYEQVREVTQEGLELSRRLGARFQEAIFLNNLGTAEFEMGICRAIQLHRQAQEVAVELDNDYLRALTYRTLGGDYHAQEHFELAREHFAEAARLYAKLGHNARETYLQHILRQFGYLDS